MENSRISSILEFKEAFLIFTKQQDYYYTRAGSHYYQDYLQKMNMSTSKYINLLDFFNIDRNEMLNKEIKNILNKKNIYIEKGIKFDKKFLDLFLDIEYKFPFISHLLSVVIPKPDIMDSLIELSTNIFKMDDPYCFYYVSTILCELTDEKGIAIIDLFIDKLNADDDIYDGDTAGYFFSYLLNLRPEFVCQYLKINLSKVKNDRFKDMLESFYSTLCN
jgi:hypothetical protein